VADSRAGHLYLGKKAKSIIFFAVVTLTFFFGLAMDGRVYLASPSSPCPTSRRSRISEWGR